jgi:hypothetical protein
MTIHHAAMLAGLFLVPLAALWIGHRLTRRPARARAVFWGLIFGHTIAALAVTIAALYLPERWDASAIVRGAVGFWGLLLGGVVGAAVGWLLSREAARAPGRDDGAA